MSQNIKKLIFLCFFVVNIVLFAGTFYLVLLQGQREQFFWLQCFVFWFFLEFFVIDFCIVFYTHFLLCISIIKNIDEAKIMLYDIILKNKTVVVNNNQNCEQNKTVNKKNEFLLRISCFQFFLPTYREPDFGCLGFTFFLQN